MFKYATVDDIKKYFKVVFEVKTGIALRVNKNVCINSNERDEKGKRVDVGGWRGITS